jgi:hypothetical protein
VLDMIAGCVVISWSVNRYDGWLGGYGLVFPTQLLTSEDEYKWYWHQMIYFPETINTISRLNTIGRQTFTRFF